MVIKGKSMGNAIKELTENKTANTGADSDNIGNERVSQNKSGVITKSKIKSSDKPGTLHKRDDLTQEELEWLHREEATIAKLKNKLISQKRYSANLKEKNKILKNEFSGSKIKKRRKKPLLRKEIKN